MSRKNRTDGIGTAKKKRTAGESVEILSLKLENTDASTIKRHLAYLVGLSLLTKFFVIVVTTSVFHSFIDLFDIGFYFDHGMMLIQGQLPYVNYFFDYPILIFVPTILALIPALLLQDTMVFVYSFQILMVLCDLLITICVYLIGLRIWDQKTALYAGLIYATAFSSAYFVLTKYDAFPTVLLMMALLCTVYGAAMKGYVTTAAGFFAKIFPVIALPFIVLFNAKESSIKQEIYRSLKVFLPLIAILILPFLAFRTDIINTYLPIRTGMDYYSNTVTFTIYSWLHDVFGTAISLDVILGVMFVMLVAGLLALVYLAYSSPQKDPVLLLKLVLTAIVLVIFCVKVRSPQYLVWFTPLLCILAADDIRKIILVYLVQCMAYIEFPLLFRTYYVSTQYTDPVLSPGWFTILIVFTLEYVILFACIWLVVNPKNLLENLRKASD